MNNHPQQFESNKEILRIQGITKSLEGISVLNNFSLRVFAGEIVSILMPLGSRVALLDVLSGKAEFEGRAYFDEVPVHGSFKGAVNEGKIVYIPRNVKLVGELNVAENMVILNRFIKKRNLLNKKLINQISKDTFEEIGISINPWILASELTRFQMHLVELAKTIHSGAKLIVLDNIISDYGDVDKEQFIHIITGLKRRGYAFVFVCTDINDIFGISDRSILFQEGRNVRTFYPTDDFTTLNLFQSTKSDISENNYCHEKQSVLELRNISTNDLHNISFTLHKSEIVGIYDPENKYNILLSDVIIGKTPVQDGEIVVAGQKVYLKALKEAHKAGIVFLQPNFSFNDIYENMSVFDNIFLPLAERMSNFMTIIHPGYKKYLQSEIEEQLGIDLLQQKKKAKSQDIYTRQKIVLFRMLLYKPKVLICVMPFMNTDFKMQSVIRSYFEQYVKAGVSILFISSNSEDFLYQCNRVLTISNGYLIDETNSNNGLRAYQD